MQKIYLDDIKLAVNMLLSYWFGANAWRKIIPNPSLAITTGIFLGAFLRLLFFSTFHAAFLSLKTRESAD